MANALDDLPVRLRVPILLTADFPLQAVNLANLP
jgi:hypothetical protein